MGSKKRHRFRRSRKGKGFSGVSKHEVQRAETTETAAQSQTPSTSSPVQPPEIESDKVTSASRTKMELHGYKDQSSSSSDDDHSDDEACGYRLIDLRTFSSSISDLHKCDEGEFL